MTLIKYLICILELFTVILIIRPKESTCEGWNHLAKKTKQNIKQNKSIRGIVKINFIGVANITIWYVLFKIVPDCGTSSAKAKSLKDHRRQFQSVMTEFIWLKNNLKNIQPTQEHFQELHILLSRFINQRHFQEWK